MFDTRDKSSMPLSPPALLSKLARRLMLSPSDQKALLAAASPPRHVAKGDHLIEEGQKTTSLVILCSGMARSLRTLEDGSQQIVAIFVAGEALNPGELMFPRSRTAISALTPATSLPIPLEKLNQLVSERPTIARALWWETAAQAAIQQEWMVWLGRRSASVRLAHLLCEVSYRLQAGDQDAKDAFDLPLTQHELADILGLSTVHVNRTLQVLRSRNLIELSRNRLTIRDKAGLYEIAEFDIQYLSGLKQLDAGESQNA
ncbi:Crp/Fnr family transcriptional regulator [Bradyrhizobium macuxiense]|uniref:Crp/Fnr family transcriptional regulator n=1 Tax=Bradyrhizobium macuxiense TaxID=1755647 RepID=A0A560LKR1_9BRAD|nr:Crp/Fnr family transcriptional regulator [Bradyrhizobium macuxiense]TWB96116.1 Crp/Fnr family transcriptional regulator [Bradyrhizobium macuxiense]